MTSLRVLLVSFALIVSFLSLVKADGELFNSDYFDESSAPLRQMKANIQWAHITPAQKQIREGNYTGAFGDIDFALRYYPNHPTALQLISVLAQLQKKLNLPIRYFEKAVNLFPQYAITHAQYGGYLVSIGNMELAIEKLRKAVEIDPKFAGPHVLLARAYSKTGNMELARQEADRARQLGYQGKIE